MLVFGPVIVDAVSVQLFFSYSFRPSVVTSLYISLVQFNSIHRVLLSHLVFRNLVSNCQAL